ncbi:hypothetical protein HK096_002582 [Nowakowskiella sp. JEL0078]|nr:hypothetical protein HK096_002582 [Nowakowskiella sp. JEL0078]
MRTPSPVQEELIIDSDADEFAQFLGTENGKPKQAKINVSSQQKTASRKIRKNAILTSSSPDPPRIDPPRIENRNTSEHENFDDNSNNDIFPRSLFVPRTPRSASPTPKGKRLESTLLLLSPCTPTKRQDPILPGLCTSSKLPETSVPCTPARHSESIISTKLNSTHSQELTLSVPSKHLNTIPKKSPIPMTLHVKLGSGENESEIEVPYSPGPSGTPKSVRWLMDEASQRYKLMHGKTPFINRLLSCDPKTGNHHELRRNDCIPFISAQHQNIIAQMEEK